MTVHNTYTPAFLRRPDAIATKRLTPPRVRPILSNTPPGSFGERARSRSARADSCFLLHRCDSNYGLERSANAP